MTRTRPADLTPEERDRALWWAVLRSVEGVAAAIVKYKLGGNRRPPPK